MAGSIYTALFGSGGNAANNQLGNISFADGAVITTTTGNGLTICGNTNQKVALWGATPVVQPNTTGELVGLSGKADNTTNATNMNSNGNSGNAALDVNDIVKLLKLLGAHSS